MTEEHMRRNRMLWLDVAFASRNRGINGAIKPVTVGDDDCFGITIGQRWIFGSDGNLTTFDTPQAARHFLHLLGFSGTVEDRSGESVAIPAAGYEVFQLRHQRLHLRNDPVASPRSPPDRHSRH